MGIDFDGCRATSLLGGSIVVLGGEVDISKLGLFIIAVYSWR